MLFKCSQKELKEQNTNYFNMNNYELAMLALREQAQVYLKNMATLDECQRVISKCKRLIETV